MKLTLVIALMVLVVSCSKQNGVQKPSEPQIPLSEEEIARLRATDPKEVALKIERERIASLRISSSTNMKPHVEKIKPVRIEREITGKLSGDVRFNAQLIESQYRVTLSPPILKTDANFVSVSMELISTLYGDSVESAESLSDGIGGVYHVFQGKSIRYRVYNFKDDEGRIYKLETTMIN